MNRCNDFVLIVVLFILLIIVGASFYSGCRD
ncbi:MULTISPECIES: YjcZ family sporulation protein [unclassified Bacillus (in: firmicutes)]|nr:MULTISPECIES: YjcZ family sporulation protein [unclassified Bacillus (in: firmicutes)]